MLINDGAKHVGSRAEVNMVHEKSKDFQNSNKHGYKQKGQGNEAIPKQNVSRTYPELLTSTCILKLQGTFGFIVHVFLQTF